MRNALPILLEYVTNRDWAMELSIFHQMAEVVENHIARERLSQEQIDAITATKREKGSDERKYEVTMDGRAIIPVSGVIAKHSRMVNGLSQPRGTSIDSLIEQLDAALDDRDVKSILLHIESPGGCIDGVSDFADQIYRASFDKPIVAFADDLCASAAYWLASQANKIYTNRAGDVGSIGVYTLYVDTSEAAKKQGLKFFIFRSGQHKGVGELGIAITDENMAAIQERIDGKFELFLSTVFRGRAAAGLDLDTLRELADGRTFMGTAALELDLVDGICHFDEVLRAELPAARNERLAMTGAIEKNKSVLGDRTMLTKNDLVQTATNRQTGLTDPERQEVASFARMNGTTPEKITGFWEAVEIRMGFANCSKGKAVRDVAHLCPTLHSRWLDEQRTEDKSKMSDGSQMSEGDDGRVETYTAAVEKFKAGGMSKAKAMLEAARKFTNSHEAWKSTQPKIGP